MIRQMATMVPPAVRMVIVCVRVVADEFDQFGEPEVECRINPVVALVGTIEDGDGGKESVSFDCLVVDPDGGLVRAREMYREPSKYSIEYVVAPWDASEDEHRLQGITEQLRNEALWWYKEYPKVEGQSIKKKER